MNDFVYTDEMYNEDKKISYFVFKNKLHLPEDIKQEYKNDLIQTSLIQLYKARQNFDETQGVKYISYAVKTSLNTMIKYKDNELKKSHNGNKISLSKELTEDLTLEETLGNCDIYPRLEQDKLKALKEFLKDVITKPRKYKPSMKKRDILKRKTGLRKHQKITLEHFVDGKSRPELQKKYNVSRQYIEQSISRYTKMIQDALLKSDFI